MPNEKSRRTKQYLWLQAIRTQFSFLQQKGNIFFYFFIKKWLNFLPQDICTSAGLRCQANLTHPPCTVACEGLYADVAFSSQPENQKDQDKFGLLMEEYKRFRDQSAPNIVFSSGAGAKKNYSKCHHHSIHLYLKPSFYSHPKQTGTSNSPHLLQHCNLWSGDYHGNIIFKGSFFCRI